MWFATADLVTVRRYCATTVEIGPVWSPVLLLPIHPLTHRQLHLLLSLTGLIWLNSFVQSVSITALVTIVSFYSWANDLKPNVHLYCIASIDWFDHMHYASCHLLYFYSSFSWYKQNTILHALLKAITLSCDLNLTPVSINMA